MSALHSFSWLNTIPFYGYTTFITFYLFIHRWTLGSFHLLAVVNSALWIFMCKYLLEDLFSVLWGIYLEIELLGHVVILCLTFWGIRKFFKALISQPPLVSNQLICPPPKRSPELNLRSPPGSAQGWEGWREAETTPLGGPLFSITTIVNYALDTALSVRLHENPAERHYFTDFFLNEEIDSERWNKPYYI